LFDFSTRAELDFVVNSELHRIIAEGTQSYKGNHIAMYLSQNNNQIAIWPSGTELVYIETESDFAARELIDVYLSMYPSDLEARECYDPDGKNYFVKSTTERVKIGSDVVKFTDVCLKDYPPYLDGSYVPPKRVGKYEGLLEGLCGTDGYGYFYEHECPTGCKDGACELT